MNQSAENKAQILDNHTKEPQPFNLAQLMFGDLSHPDPDSHQNPCFVTGVELLANGTSAFEEAIKKFLKPMRFTTNETEKATQILKGRPYFVKDTGFRAFRYANPDGSIMPAGVLTDMLWLGISYRDTAEMIILPYGDPEDNPHRKLFNAGTTEVPAHFLYTGNLVDAIREFEQKGFGFHLARLPADFGEISKSIEQRPHEKPPIYELLTEINVPLGRILEVISSDPNLYPNLYSAPAL